MKNKITRMIAIFTSALLLASTAMTVSADTAEETNVLPASAENDASQSSDNSEEEFNGFVKRYTNPDGTEYVKKYTPLDFCFTGWYKVEGGPAEMSSSTGTNCVLRKEGTNYRDYINNVSFTINNAGGKERGGMDRWDCGLYTQIDHPFTANNIYVISFIVKADHDGTIYTRIGDENDHDIWHNGMGFTEIEKFRTNESEFSYSCKSFADSYEPISVEAGYYYNIKSYVRCTKNMDIPIWEFQFGGAGDYQPEDCFPEGTHLLIGECYSVSLSDYDFMYSKEFPEYQKVISENPDMKQQIDELLSLKSELPDKEYSQMLTQVDDRCYHNWYVSEFGPAEVKAKVRREKWSDDGVNHSGQIDYLDIQIQNPGGKSRGGLDRWDAGIVTDLGDIEKDQYYYVEYTIEASEDGEMYTRIGNSIGNTDIWHNNTGFTMIGSNSFNKPNKNNDYTFEFSSLSYENSWYNIKLKGNTEYKFAGFVKAKTNIKDAVWEFQFGGNGDYQAEDCFPEDTKLHFRDFAFYKVSEDDIAYSTVMKNYAKDYELTEDEALADIMENRISEKIEFEQEIHAAPATANNSETADETDINKETENNSTDDTQTDNEAQTADTEDTQKDLETRTEEVSDTTVNDAFETDKEPETNSTETAGTPTDTNTASDTGATAQSDTAEDTIIPMTGDMNGDGVADLTDLTLLSIFLMSGENADTDILKIGADIDCNGIIDIADLARFKQFISHDPAVTQIGIK